jgi:hypothetical protein
MRKILALLLATFLLMPTTLAVSETNQALAASQNAKKVINALDIMETDAGEIKTTAKKITRAQFAQLLVNISDQKDMVAVTNTSLFKDVKKSHWAAPYIRTAVNKGWMSGYLNGTFKPDQGVTLIEAVNGVLNLLGYSNSYFSGNLTQSKMAFYKSKKMNHNIKVTMTSSYIDYNDCVNLLYNTLNTANKDGKVYAEVLGYSLDTKGEVDYLSVINSGTEGPIVAVNDWTSEIPFNIESATYYKNDARSAYTDIEKYDILYYSESSKTIWAYDAKVSGIITAVAPDLINPTSVTVAGTNYEFESSSAAQQFATLGEFEKGDIVTLLLGKNGKIAGALNSDEYNSTVTGLVLEVGTHLVQNESGSFYTSDYVTFVDAAGNKYTQDFDSSQALFEKEDLIRVTYKNGKATVTNYPYYKFDYNGYTVNSSGTYFGTIKFAPHISILDYYNGSYTKVYPIRLANLQLNSSNVLYYNTNFDGEISELILYNVTGDFDKYGIFIGLDPENATTYKYIINGTSGQVTYTTLESAELTEGPVGFVYKNGTLSSTYALTRLVVDSLGNNTIAAGTTKYPISDNVSVYVQTGDKYALSSLDKINTSKYKVTAYIDKAVALGGSIRVIIAEPIN